MSRLFIGIFLPEEVKKPILELQDSLSKMPMRAKAVEPKNLHLTLTFLGEVSETEIPQITEKLDAVCKNTGRFTVKLGGVKLIPSENYVRVIAVDVESSNDVLENLRKDAVKEVGGDSHPVHLTLARVREVSDKQFLARNLKGTTLNKFFEVSSVQLIKSVVTKRGPRYHILHNSDLGV